MTENFRKRGFEAADFTLKELRESMRDQMNSVSPEDSREYFAAISEVENTIYLMKDKPRDMGLYQVPVIMYSFRLNDHKVNDKWHRYERSSGRGGIFHLTDEVKAEFSKYSAYVEKIDADYYEGDVSAVFHFKYETEAIAFYEWMLKNYGKS